MILKSPDPQAADPTAERLARLLPVFMDLINRRSTGDTMQIMSEHGITLPQMVTLHALRHHHELSVQGVQEALRLSASASSALIDKLVEKGFVDRRENPADRRQKQLHLTPSGEELLDRIARSRAGEFTTAAQAIDPELRVQLANLFERVIDQLCQGDPPCQPL